MFGSTPTGADWCVKALHPSDPMTEVRGIPDQSALPSLCMNYQSTFTLTPPNGSTGLWQFDASLIPHPVCFMAYSMTTSLGQQNGNLFNSQLEGATHATKYQAFKELAQRWRLAYMSVTVYQDGPDLANQGTLVVAQPPVSPRVRFVGSPRGTSAGVALPVLFAPKACEWTQEDRPDFNRSQAMPNAYFNKSKEGAYIPLKLTETCQDWVSEADEIGQAVFTPHPVPTANNTGIYSLGNALAEYPFYDLAQILVDGTGYLTGQSTSCPLSGNWAHVSARNLAVTTSYSFFVRCGIEMQVSPSSTLSPQLKLSPPYDPVALTTYYSVCRELKDAYPADYNTTGKLWGVIKQALNALDPYVKMLPGANIIRPLGMAGVAVGDAVVARRQRKKKAKKVGLSEGPIMMDNGKGQLVQVGVAQRKRKPRARKAGKPLRGNRRVRAK